MNNLIPVLVICDGDPTGGVCAESPGCEDCGKTACELEGWLKSFSDEQKAGD